MWMILLCTYLVVVQRVHVMMPVCCEVILIKVSKFAIGIARMALGWGLRKKVHHTSKASLRCEGTVARVTILRLLWRVSES